MRHCRMMWPTGHCESVRYGHSGQHCLCPSPPSKFAPGNSLHWYTWQNSKPKSLPHIFFYFPKVLCYGIKGLIPGYRYKLAIHFHQRCGQPRRCKYEIPPKRPLMQSCLPLTTLSGLRLHLRFCHPSPSNQSCIQSHRRGGGCNP